MHEEASFFKNFFEWFKGNFEWFSWVFTGAVYVMYRLHRYFTGLNRIADVQESQGAEIREIKEKLSKMVDGEGVDLRVAPVISAVQQTQSQVNEIHSYFISAGKSSKGDA